MLLIVCLNDALKTTHSKDTNHIVERKSDTLCQINVRQRGRVKLALLFDLTFKHCKRRSEHEHCSLEMNVC